MVNIKNETYGYKVIINSSTGLVRIIGKITAVLEVSGKEIVYEQSIEKSIGFVESVRADTVREVMKEIAHELYEKEEKYIKGLKEIESLQFEIEIY